MTTLPSLAGLTRPEASTSETSPARVAAPRRRWVTRLVVPGVILLGLLLVLGYAARRTLWSALPVEVSPVIVKAGGGPAPSAGAGELSTQAPGWVEADPYAVNVAALADGTVKDVLVLEGDRVEANQVVARLIDDEAKLAYTRAIAEHQVHEALLRSAQTEMHAAQRVWDRPTELTRAIQATQAALDGANADLVRLTADIAASAAAVAQTRDEFERTSRLSESSAAAQGELAQITLKLRAQEASLEALKAQKPVAEARIRQMEAESRAAKESLELRIEDKRRLETAKAELSKAEAEYNAGDAMQYEAKLRLDRMEVRSPVAGIVQARLVEVGSRVMTNGNSPGDSYVLRVYDPKKLQARVDIPLADAAKVRVGDRAEVLTEALPDHVFRGRVTRLVHEANIQKNTVQVKVAIEDPIEDLRPEMLVRARFFSTPRATPAGGAASPAGDAVRLFIPEAALTRMGSTPMVWVVNQAHMTADMRHPQVRPAEAGFVEVTEGLNPGDRVILSPPESLGQGDRLRIVGSTEGARHEPH
jgi:HlyD family secretion protein